MANRQTVSRVLRILAGIPLTALILYAATLAAKDCTVGLYVFENCLWEWLREFLGLPPNKVLRAVVLELVGLALLAGLYLTYRFVFPPWKARAATPAELQQNGSQNSGTQ